MAFEESNGTGMIMPVAPTGGSGFGGFGGDGWWIILLFVLLGGGMWGGNGMMGGMGLYPWMNQADITTSGFANQALQSGIYGVQSAVTSGFGDVQNSLCAGFAGVNATVNGAQNALTQQMYTNQIADLERSFAAQTANTQGMTALQAQLAQCCCDNRLATANQTATILAENCADRAAVTDGVRDLLAAGTANTQAILNVLTGGIQAVKDELCKQTIDAKNDKIAALERQLAILEIKSTTPAAATGA